MRQSLRLLHSEASFQANEASNFCFPKERLLILFRAATAIRTICRENRYGSRPCGV